MSTESANAGDLLREWRQRRRMTQMELALDAEISTRHLSFVETGRAKPSREMVMLLAERLDVPLRERNELLVAAGYAPVYAARRRDDPALRRAIEIVLRGHEPYPALAIDRHWNLVAANAAVGPFLEGIAPELLAPPVNVIRLSVHRDGLAPRIVNIGEWRGHLIERLRKQVELTADPVLRDLLGEVRRSSPAEPPVHTAYGGLLVPLQLRIGDSVLSFFSTTTMFGTPVDITLAEIAIESFFPADQETSEAMRG